MQWCGRERACSSMVVNVREVVWTLPCVQWYGSDRTRSGVDVNVRAVVWN